MAALKATNKAKVDGEVDKMKKEWDLFCRSLSPEHLDQAQALAQELAKQGHPQPPLEAYTKQIYEKQFKSPGMAQHEEAVNLLQDLEVAQTNLNQDPGSKALADRFVRAARDTAAQLAQRYGVFWTAPTADSGSTEADQSAA